MRLSTVSILVLFAGLSACGPRSETEESASAKPAACEDLATLTLARTTIASAQTVAAGAFVAPTPAFEGWKADYSALPAFCRVTGSIAPSPDSDIQFEVWLPAEHWNGKFLQTGNGGAAGSIVYASLAEPLSRGYAAANTDTGHRGEGGDFTWAEGHPEKMKDYQYRAVHELTTVGKAITEARYGKAPEKSYWYGCSTGGRQGLKEAQRFPEDYDGIIAGAPANNWSPLMALSVSIQRSLGRDGLGVDKLGVLKEAAIAACDAGDGVKDRVIAEPSRCGFDPASVQCGKDPSEGCLSASEVAAARRIYAGVVDGAGDVLIPGTGPGSELEWAAYASPGFGIGTNYYRHVVVGDASWDPAKFDVDADVPRAERVDGGAAKAMDPDLSAYVGHGGKLILYHGTADGLIPYGNTVSYYDSVVAKLGARAAAGGATLYLVPGMTHCSGGDGAYEVDWLSALEGWVEKSETPGALHARHPAESPGGPLAPPSTGPPFSRPVCVYPQVARYKGSGDQADAANFDCVVP
jgi:Tannase and feruloyl esterase